MRGIRPGAIVAVTVLIAAAAPADARPIEYSSELSSTGAITVTWHGDPARGCAQAGLCGYRGSVETRWDDGEFDLTVVRHRVLGSFGFLDSFRTPLVRVKRTESDGTDAVCVDALSTDSGEVIGTNAGVDRVRLGLRADALSAGRCAGPDVSSRLARLPRRTRSLSRLTRRGGTVDFSGEVPFAAGRFSGTIRSTLRVRFGPASPNSYFTIPSRPPRRRHRRPLVRIVQLSASYRVSSLTGSLSTSFAGLADPPCDEGDSCGVTGTSTWGLSGHRGTLRIDAAARARRGDRGLAGALAAIGRRGAYVFGDADLGRDVGTTTVDLSRPGGSACHDTASVASPGLAAYNGRPGRLTLDLGGEDSYPTSADLIRTGCPGPRDSEAIGLGSLAEGSVPIRRLGRRAFTVDMRRSSHFTTDAYSGRRSARFTAGLRRVSMHVVYKRARGIG